MNPISRKGLSSRDLLVTRPDVPLPTTLDPQGPRARGYPADPKPTPAERDNQLDNPDPSPRDVRHTA